MVPQIQYQLADPSHYAVQGNIYLYLGMALSTSIFWPLPLLHGRKPYILVSFAFAIPLQFPQAIVVMTFRDPDTATFRAGLLVSRLIIGFLLGFANINLFPTLLDLFGASLQAEFPHGELTIEDDPRRDGGGLGTWLGFWTWSAIASIAIGFAIGAAIINSLNPQWGFYIAVIMMVVTLALSIITPETRRSPWRHCTKKVFDEDENIKKLVGRGEIKLHISTEGPKWWWEEVWAGIRLSFRMLLQRGFFVLATYIGWIYAQIVLVIMVCLKYSWARSSTNPLGQLIGALLSREYRWHSQHVGAATLSIAVGALLAVPLSRANWLSRSRIQRARTDNQTLLSGVIWTSHMARRLVFMFFLPFAGLAYTLSSPGVTVHFMLPIVFAGLIGFLSNLAIAECLGLLMETFDTSDLQPGVNTRHRAQSMATVIRRRRTNYSSFPRVSAGFFVSQSIGFVLAATATGVGGAMTRNLGAQLSTGVTSLILLGLTLLLTAVLWRFQKVQVIPETTFGSGNEDFGNMIRAQTDWRPVVVGHPSGKIRRMNVLELGHLSRWTEIRKLNRLIKE